MFDMGSYSKEIELLCRQFGIVRIEVFGSAATDDFAPESDIDLLIEFANDGGNLFHRYFDLKYALEDLFGRPVDLVVESAISNPYFRQAVDRSRQLVYAA
jgi:uncharacterized protein